MSFCRLSFFKGSMQIQRSIRHDGNNSAKMISPILKILAEKAVPISDCKKKTISRK